MVLMEDRPYVDKGPLRQQLEETEWTEEVKWDINTSEIWELRHEDHCVFLRESSDPYLGRYMAYVVGDCSKFGDFPRYYMNLDRAKAEVKEWLVNRLYI